MTTALAEAVRSIKCVVENKKRSVKVLLSQIFSLFHGQISTLIPAHDLFEVCRGKKHCMSNI